MSSYYEILNVSNISSQADIKKAYHKLALKYHPDKNKSVEAEEIFKNVTKAYATLSDPDKRRFYDISGIESDDNVISSEEAFEMFNNMFQQFAPTLFDMSNMENIQYSDIEQFNLNDFNITVLSSTIPTVVNACDSNIINDISTHLLQSMNVFKEKPVDLHKYNNITEPISKPYSIIELPIESKQRSDDIFVTIDVTISDVYLRKIKLVTISRLRKQIDNTYTRVSKKFKVPCFTSEITLHNEADEIDGYIECGDIIVTINILNDTKFILYNENDLLLHHDISISDIYNGFTFKTKMPNKESVIIESLEASLLESKNYIQKIPKKGLPLLKDDNKVYRGDLYIKFNIKLPQIITTDDKTIINRLFHSNHTKLLSKSNNFILSNI
jgi:DnaJ-class molecular chaperone